MEEPTVRRNCHSQINDNKQTVRGYFQTELPNAGTTVAFCELREWIRLVVLKLLFLFWQTNKKSVNFLFSYRFKDIFTISK